MFYIVLLLYLVALSTFVLVCWLGIVWPLRSAWNRIRAKRYRSAAQKTALGALMSTHVLFVLVSVALFLFNWNRLVCSDGPRVGVFQICREGQAFGREVHRAYGNCIERHGETPEGATDDLLRLCQTESKDAVQNSRDWGYP